MEGMAAKNVTGSYSNRWETNVKLFLRPVTSLRWQLTKGKNYTIKINMQLYL